MRRTILSMTVGVSLFLFASAACQAQTPGATNLGADPFSLYYGWYLPNQAYQSLQPRIEDTINSNVAMRQYNAYADRAGLFDQGSPFGGAAEEDDPFRAFGQKRIAPKLTSRSHGSDMNAIRGLGPSVYYGGGRVASYYPRMGRGRGTNQNVVTLRTRRGGGGGGFGGGMPGMGPR